MSAAKPCRPKQKSEISLATLGGHGQRRPPAAHNLLTAALLNRAELLKIDQIKTLDIALIA